MNAKMTYKMRKSWFMVLEHDKTTTKRGEELTPADFANTIVAGPFQTLAQAEDVESALYVDESILTEKE